MSNTNLKELFTKFLGEQMAPEELAQLQKLIQDEKNNEELDQLLAQTYTNKAFATGTDYDSEEVFAELRKRMKVVPVRNMFWKRIAVAASVLLIIGISSYLLFFNKKEQQTEIARTQEDRFKNDVNPGGYRARLTLADGREIILDSAAIGELTKQGSTAIINKDGQLVYQTNGKTNEVLYNTLSTAKGETYATVLADGSKVWLNSGSSIKYPVAFIGNERKVEITGEAYFEVAHNASKPFIVNKGTTNITVLGTHFNVNGYDDENSLKVTLLEGSVKVNTLTIKPGQQAVVADNGQLTTNYPDVEQVMAWKNGLFDFSSANLETVMRQLARWYNIEVVYADKTNVSFSGGMRRDTKLSEMLRAIELTANVHFSIDGNKVTVTK